LKTNVGQAVVSRSTIVFRGSISVARGITLAGAGLLIGCLLSCASSPGGTSNTGGAAGSPPAGAAGVTGTGGGSSGAGGTAGSGVAGGSAGTPGDGGATQGAGGAPGSGGVRVTGLGGVSGAGGQGHAGSTGASTDAGRTDSGMADATSGSEAGTTAGCAGLLCEDFEKGLIDPAVWDVQRNGGQPAPGVVSGAGLVAHGKYAGHFHANPGVVSYDFMITKDPPAALKGHHFGRAYFMITPMPPAEHTEFIYSGTSGFPEYKYLEVASVDTSVWQLTYVDQVPPNTGENYHSGGKMPLGKWFCLEWEFNDTPDQATVYVDGAPSFTQDNFTFNGVSTGLVGGFAAFGFGFYIWHPATYAFDVYYDDIVLDIKQVHCL
jgi:hypothetical protein